MAPQSIHRERSKLRKEQAINVRQEFQIHLFNISVIHWDGKFLPSSTSKNLVDRLPVIISSENHKQLLSVPKLLVGTGQEQSTIVFQLIEEWGLNNSVIAVCCDTRSSNTGRLKGACVLLERLEKDLLCIYIIDLIFNDSTEIK